MALPQIPDGVKWAAKWFGYPIFAFFVFVVSLYWSLPRDRIQEKLESVASQQLNLDVSIGDLGLTLFSGAGVSASTIELKTRPQQAGERPARFPIDDLTAHVGLLDYLRGKTDLNFDAHLADGAVSGEIQLNPGVESGLALDARGIVIKRVPALAQGAAGLPLDGTVDLKVDLKLAKGMVAQAAGEIDLTCAGCAIGDGKAKLVVPGDVMLAQGLTFPRIVLGKLGGSLVVDKGRATFKDFKAHSPDVDLELDGYIELRDPITMSPVHLYLRFKPSDALAKREDKIELMNQMLAMTAKRSDGYFGFSITGTLGAMIPMPSKEPPPGVLGGKGIATPSRPVVPAFRPPPVAAQLEKPRVAEPPPPPPQQVIDVPEGGPNAGNGAPPPSTNQPVQTASPTAVPPIAAPTMNRFGGQLRGILPAEGGGVRLPPHEVGPAGGAGGDHGPGGDHAAGAGAPPPDPSTPPGPPPTAPGTPAGSGDEEQPSPENPPQ